MSLNIVNEIQKRKKKNETPKDIIKGVESKILRFLVSADKLGEAYDSLEILKGITLESCEYAHFQQAFEVLVGKLSNNSVYEELKVFNETRTVSIDINFDENRVFLGFYKDIKS